MAGVEWQGQIGRGRMVGADWQGQNGRGQNYLRGKLDGGKNVQGVERKGANWYRDQNSRIKKGRGQNSRGKRDGNHIFD